ncbi:MAG: hypothetical protein AAFQ43_00275 [Bacteroidota bacterium]
MATFTYDGTNTAHSDFVLEVERRMDEVAGDGETPRLQAGKVYAFGVEAVLQMLRTADQLLLSPLAVDLATQGALEGTAILDPSVSSGAPTIGVRYHFQTVSPRFLRFVRAKIEGWPRAVEAAERTGTAAHAREASPYTRAPAFRPRVYLQTGSGRFTLECYPGPTVTFESLVIFQETAPEAWVSKAPELSDALYWATAARVLRAERYAELADAADASAASAMGAQRLGLEGEPDVTPNPSMA